MTPELQEFKLSIERIHKCTWVYLGAGNTFKTGANLFSGCVYSLKATGVGCSVVRCDGTDPAFHYFAPLDSNIVQLNGFGQTVEVSRRISL